MIEKYSWLDEHLMKQDAAEREFQPAWQAYKYILDGKMYAYIGTNDKNKRPIITMKLPPDFSDTLRLQHEDIVPGYYMNKTHWSSVYLDGNVPQKVILDMADAAYDVVFSSLSKRKRWDILTR
jgi:predicted DNA-binding protein (MmcQ/YjbR family)